MDLSCSYTYPRGYTVTKTEWYKWKSGQGYTYNIQDQPEYAGRVQYRGDKNREATLTITDLRETDAAEYKFSIITDKPGGKWKGEPGVTLSVTGIVILSVLL